MIQDTDHILNENGINQPEIKMTEIQPSQGIYSQLQKPVIARVD